MKVIQNVDYSKIAQLLKSNNIVAIYQGKDEGGPRALGNRSILFNPTHELMSKLVNIRKDREWYRPVAGSILLEDFSEWFDNGSIKESPFMTYAIPVKQNKIGKIQAVVHANKTCRVQTVSLKNNFHYYNIIKEFKKITGIPIIGNTSLNLGGTPMAHTMEDSLNILKNSMFEYLYLPEKKVLIYAKNKETK